MDQVIGPDNAEPILKKDFAQKAARRKGKKNYNTPIKDTFYGGKNK